MNIITPKYELLDVRRIQTKGRNAQISIRREAYSVDRLYAWTGRHGNPTKEWIQGNWEGDGEFRERVRRGLLE